LIERALVRSLWLYIAAPLLGARVGALAYQVVRGEQPGLIPSSEEA
jgi:glycerol uptake facilitator-like aquaporin